MPPLVEPHRRQLRDTLARTMPPEGADAVLAVLPASEAEMPATKEFVRAEINDVRTEIGDVRTEIGNVRNEMTAGFARVDTKTSDLRVEMIEKFANASTEMNDKIAAGTASTRRWFIATGIALATMMVALAGVVLAASNTMPG